MAAEHESTWAAIGNWGGWAALIALLGVIVRQFLPWQKMRLDAADLFQEHLLTRVQKVEDDAAAERLRMAREVKEIRDFYEAKLEAQAAEMRLDRHKMNNIDHCLTILITMIEKNPDRALEAAQAARELRASQERLEAQERGAVMAGKIVAAGSPTIIQGSAE